MKAERLIQILSNLLILSPAIYCFYYVQTNITLYVLTPLNYIIFAIPIIKNVIPKYGKLVYPITLLITFLYIFLSFIHLILVNNYVILKYFSLPLTNTAYIESLSFTFFTSLPFIFIFEGAFSLKLQRILSYLVISMADLLDMVVAIQINPLLGGNLITSFTYANALFGLNLYTLFFYGYEFISIVFHVSSTFNTYLDISFIISILGVISYFFFVSEGRKRVQMDGISYGFLYGGIITVVISYAMGFFNGSFEELMVIAISILVVLIWLRRTNKQTKISLGEIQGDVREDISSQ
jgi:hypothetical protein